MGAFLVRSSGGAKRRAGCCCRDRAPWLSQTPPAILSARASSEESIILRRFDGIPERKSRAAAEDLSLIYGSRYFVASWVASDVEETISYMPTYPTTYRPIHLRSTIALRVGCITIRFRARCTRAFVLSSSRASETPLTSHVPEFKSRTARTELDVKLFHFGKGSLAYFDPVIELRQINGSERS